MLNVVGCEEVLRGDMDAETGGVREWMSEWRTVVEACNQNGNQSKGLEFMAAWCRCRSRSMEAASSGASSSSSPLMSWLLLSSSP